MQRPRVSPRLRCLEACRGGAAEIQAFCGAIEDEQLRSGCWSLQLTGSAGCFAFCYRSF
ncbi:Hypothetical protein A7982_01650 [Minicystis rosea]|nr:Hypothetical protein A7982_01650 [Minicystis rosea]